ncbi:MAG: DUF4424 domain-containing protein [Beijerinckiaceae bacterium]|nr:DUF4424 domain-containing protein [Beijerinckiaceae bacterium]
MHLIQRPSNKVARESKFQFFVLLILVKFFVSAFPLPSTANDSMSDLAAGGLVLITNDDIVMQKEDLYLSENEIKIRYEMRNESQKIIKARVAFPLPEIPHITPSGFTTSKGGYNIAIQPPTDPNILDFSVVVNGKVINPDVEIKALLKGKDIASDLNLIGGQSLVLRSGEFMLDEAPISDQLREQLMAIGAFEKIDELIYKFPWRTYVTYHWVQDFPPGVTVIEHRYTPVIGRHLVTLSKNNKINISGFDQGASRYCITPKMIQDIKKLNVTSSDDNPLFANTLGYILKTGAHWKGRAIEEFNITIQASEKTRVTSLCTKLPLIRKRQNEFFATMKNYKPNKDLNIIFIRKDP